MFKEMRLPKREFSYHTRGSKPYSAVRNRGGVINTLCKPSLSEIASSGQNREHSPQPKQAFSSRNANPSSYGTRASVGHHAAQVPQPVQVSQSITDRW